jgi:hypothetical protein
MAKIQPGMENPHPQPYLHKQLDVTAAKRALTDFHGAS